MKNISILIKPASGNCNINCKYCFYKDEMTNRNQASYGMMSIETYENILKNFFNLHDIKNINIAFQGGEPMLRGISFFQEIINIEKKINPGIKVSYSIQTNGTLLSDEWCKFYKESNFLVGISLDGIKKTHDINRLTTTNEGTFSLVVKNIKKLKEYEINYNILTVITKDIVYNIDEIYNFYKENDFKYVQFIPCLNSLSDSKSYLYPHDFEIFLNKLFNLYYNDIIKGNYLYNRYFENLLCILLGENPEDCSLKGNCSLQYVIEANGNVYPCDFYAIDKYYLGNINKDNIKDLNLNLIKSKFIDDSYLLNQSCSKCEYINLCRCGCRRMRNKNYKNMYCSSYFNFFKKNYNKLIKLKNLIKSQKINLN